MHSKSNPTSKFRFTLLAAIAAAAFTTACGDDNEDNNDNQVNTPAEVPTPTPTPSPEEFAWSTVRIEHREDGVQPPPPDYCAQFLSFEVRETGAFRYRNPCDSTKNKSGNISANDFGALDALMNGISEDEAAADSVCTEFNDDFSRATHRMSMTSKEKRGYNLYRQDDDRECLSGNPAEITLLREKLYELQSKYTAPVEI